jgi:hypothetical protein
VGLVPDPMWAARSNDRQARSGWGVTQGFRSGVALSHHTVVGGGSFSGDVKP